MNQLTSSAADIHASPSAKPDSEKEAPMLGIFGRSSPESFAYFDPDSCSWKTSQATFLSDLETFSETWPDSGSMRNGRVYELRTWERPTCESASSWWLTEAGMSPQSGDGLATKNWPTARREDGESAGNHPGAVDSLTGATRNWPTPRTLSGGGESAERKQELGRTLSGGGDLQSASENWQTPNARDWKSETGSENNTHDKTPNLSRQVYRLLPAPTIPDGEPSSQSAPTCPRRLNPQFVEWLMGFPIGWTEL